MRSVDDFLGLITGFHRQRPRFRATIAATVSPLVEAASATTAIPPAYDLDSAVGAQLDVLGEWIGYSRRVTVPLPHAWFTLGDAARGFGKGRWRIQTDPQVGVIDLDDDIYRQLLKAKVLLNHWDGRAPSAWAIYETFLANPNTYSFVVDRHDRTTQVGIAGEIPSLQRLNLLAQGYLPARPAGVSSKILITSVNKAPIFGLGVQNNRISGFGAGAWPVSAQYLVDHGYAVRRPRPPGSIPQPPKGPPIFGLSRNDDAVNGFGRSVWKPRLAA